MSTLSLNAKSIILPIPFYTDIMKSTIVKTLKQYRIEVPDFILSNHRTEELFKELTIQFIVDFLGDGRIKLRRTSTTPISITHRDTYFDEYVYRFLLHVKIDPESVILFGNEDDRFVFWESFRDDLICYLDDAIYKVFPKVEKNKNYELAVSSHHFIFMEKETHENNILQEYHQILSLINLNDRTRKLWQEILMEKQVAEMKRKPPISRYLLPKH